MRTVQINERVCILIEKSLTFNLVGGDVAVVVGDEEGCEGQGDDHADEAEEAAPNREREKYYRRIETEILAHDFGREDKVLNGLHNGVDSHTFEPDSPKRYIAVNRANDAQQRCGQQRNELQIRHHVEHTDKQAQHHAHGQTDNREADGKEYAHAQRHKSLAAEIVVHAVLHIFDEAECELAIARRHEFAEANKQLLVIEHNKQQI